MAANSDFQVDSNFMEMLDESFFPSEIPQSVQLQVIQNTIKQRYFEVTVTEG